MAFLISLNRRYKNEINYDARKYTLPEIIRCPKLYAARNYTLPKNIRNENIRNENIRNENIRWRKYTLAQIYAMRNYTR